MIYRFLIFILLVVQPSLAHASAFLELIANENQNTLLTEVSTKPVLLDHAEIPLSILDVHKGLGYSSQVQDIFFDNQRGIYKWVFHPTDVKYREKILNFLAKKGLSTQIHQEFEGYLTISRSLFVRTPGTQNFVSLKTSTDHAPAGPWPDRPQQIRSAISSLLMSDYLFAIQASSPFANGIALAEPMLVSFPGVNLAQNTRQYDEVENSRFTYFPSSAIYSKAGLQFVKSWLGANAGYNEFKIHFSRLMGRFMAEVFVRAGVMPSSSHLQQFLLAQDKTDPSKVKIVWRDHADSHLFLPTLGRRGADQLAQHSAWINFGTRRVYTEDGIVVFSPFHGWMHNLEKMPHNHPVRLFFENEQEWTSWQIYFYEGLQAEFGLSTGSRLDLENRSTGPHIIFKIQGSEIEKSCVYQLQASLRNQLPSYEFSIPPED